jgi:hypothetical protein
LDLRIVVKAVLLDDLGIALLAKLPFLFPGKSVSLFLAGHRTAFGHAGWRQKESARNERRQDQAGD